MNILSTSRSSVKPYSKMMQLHTITWKYSKKSGHVKEECRKLKYVNEKRNHPNHQDRLDSRYQRWAYSRKYKNRR